MGTRSGMITSKQCAENVANKAVAFKGTVLSKNQVVGSDGLSPDLVAVIDNTIYIIDVTVPFENRRSAFQQAKQRKIEKYTSLIPYFANRGFSRVQIVPIVVGSLGTWDPENDIFLKKQYSTDAADVQPGPEATEENESDKNVNSSDVNSISQTENNVNSPDPSGQSINYPDNGPLPTIEGEPELMDILRLRTCRGSVVVTVKGPWPVCYEFEPSTPEDLPGRDSRCTFNLSAFKRLFIGVVWKLYKLLLSPVYSPSVTCQENSDESNNEIFYPGVAYNVTVLSNEQRTPVNTFVDTFVKAVYGSDTLKNAFDISETLAQQFTRFVYGDEANFWLNGYVNKQNCRIRSEANPQVYVETPLHPENLTVWCALWAGGIIGPYFFKNDEGHYVTVNGDRYRAMITNFFIPELNSHDVQELWFQQDCATCHTARATIDLLKDTFGDRLISRFGPMNWPPRSCDLTPLDYFLWDYVKSLVYADKPQTLDHLEDNIRRVIADIRPQMLEKVIENWTSRLGYIRVSHGCHMPEILFKM
ncbi:uncharacterized protein TNCV_2396371 [Trichonephila clavipes]|uniref:Transposase n=1 Tax=Trichonephila clavipes TaxID=2585209 RepID=A0A8X6T4G5_TRICX|nr:uncharacterized protein TNCV_2396371 [Trichonephila clavipes]